MENPSGFWKIAERYPNRLAIIENSGKTVCYGELLTECNRLVYAFRESGLKKGDSVAVLMENDTPFIEIMMATAQAGLYMVPLNWHLSEENISYILKDSESKIAIASQRFSETLINAAKLSGRSLELVLVSTHHSQLTDYSQYKSQHPSTTPENRSIGKIKTYTSGTTGFPKGVKRPLESGSPESLSKEAIDFLKLFNIHPHDDNVHLTSAPLYHAGTNSWTNMSLHVGHTIVLMDKWTPENTLELIARHKVTTMVMVPTMFHRLLNLPEELRKQADLSSLRSVIHSAAPCPVQTKQSMLNWWGPVIYEYYSASEGGGTMVGPNEWLQKPGTVGKPWPFADILILDEKKQNLGSGEIGSVYIKMQNAERFQYDGDSQKTSNAYHGDYFTAGDMGYLDEDGYLFLADRQANVIIVGGVNIYPAEIEALLISHPWIADSAVFGVPNEDLGEEIKALVQLKDPRNQNETTVTEIKNYCCNRLGKFRTPHSVEFTKFLPRDANGKINKKHLSDPYWKGRKRNK